MSFHLTDQKHNSRQQDQKSKVEDRKGPHVVPDLSGLVLDVFAEGDQTCQGSDQGSRAANVHAHQEILVVLGELGEQDRRGHVTDNLAGRHAEQEGAFSQEVGKEISHRLHACHVPRKDKEESKGKEQGIVHHPQRLAIDKQQDCGNDDKTDSIRNSSEYDGNGESEEDQIEQGTGGVEGNGGSLQMQRLGLDKDDAADRDERNGKHKGERHDRHKFSRGDLKFGIQIEVLRISKGGKHSSKVCRNVLHDEGKRQIAHFVRCGKHEKAKGQKGQECHIVGDQHRADKGDIHQCQNTPSRVSEQHNDPSGENIKEINVFECADHSQHAKEAGQGLDVKIFEVFLVGRNDQACNQRRTKGNTHHGVAPYEVQSLFYRFFSKIERIHKVFDKLLFQISIQTAEKIQRLFRLGFSLSVLLTYFITHNPVCQEVWRNSEPRFSFSSNPQKANQPTVD